jgi:hypothetical protein
MAKKPIWETIGTPIGSKKQLVRLTDAIEFKENIPHDLHLKSELFEGSLGDQKFRAFLSGASLILQVEPENRQFVLSLANVVESMLNQSKTEPIRTEKPKHAS